MDSVNEVKSRLDIADLIGEYLPMKPAGSGSFKALCPFHNEKTPSFYISRTRQTWHCFGCNEGGDHFSFVQKIEGMEFRECLEFLAQKVGYQLPEYRPQSGDGTGQKKRLHEVNELAMRFFRSALHNLPEAEIARAYLKKRGLDDLTTDTFQLGYAPDSWSIFSEALMKKGVSADELVKAGLAIKKEHGDGIFDRFRHRVMFPINDVHGNIVGFTGRILSDDKKEAKYMNTPETAVYKKSAVLYGLDKAKAEIRRQDMAVIVEGNMDVIASHQFSVTNVVASSGTALTSEQLALLKRFTTNLAIAFDQDAAGQTATLRGLDVARLQDFSIKIISLPPDAGKDADEAIRKDPAIWKQAIQNAVSVMEWVYRSGFKNKQPERPEDKKDIADFILPEILRIADALEQDHWLRKLAKDLDTSIEVLKAKKLPKLSPSLGTAKGKAGVGTNPDQNMTGQAAAEALTAEHYLFALIISQKMLPAFVIEELKLKPEEWEHETIRSLYKALFFGYDPNIQSMSQPHITGVDINRPPATLEADQTNLLNILAFLAERDFKAWSLDQGKKEIQTRVSVMRDVRRQTERRRLENEMRQAERTGDTAKITEIMQQFQALRES